MRKILLKTTSDPYLFQWMDLPILGVQTSSPREFGTLSELSAEIKRKNEAVRLIFLAPAMAVQVRQLSFLPAERKHLSKTVPYTLEEEMICDVSELHCVMTKPASDTLWVAAVQKNDMRTWLKRFDEAGLKVDECIPEQVVLLEQASDWCMYFENGEFLLRSGGAQVHGVDLQNIALALELTTQGFSQIPPNIDLYLNEEADSEDALAKIPEVLHESISTHVTPFPQMLNQRMNVARDLDLLCGEFAQGMNISAELKKWRGLLWLLLAGLLVHGGVAFAEYNKSDKELKQIRSQIVSLHKQVFPSGKLTNSRKALEGELKRLQGGGTGASFLGTLKEASSVLEAHPDFELNALSFSADKGALEFDVILNDHAEVEKFKTELIDKGLNAELLNSVGQGDQVKARMLITSAP